MKNSIVNRAGSVRSNLTDLESGLRVLQNVLERLGTETSSSQPAPAGREISGLAYLVKLLAQDAECTRGESEELYSELETEGGAG